MSKYYCVRCGSYLNVIHRANPRVWHCRCGRTTANPKADYNERDTAPCSVCGKEIVFNPNQGRSARDDQLYARTRFCEKAGKRNWEELLFCSKKCYSKKAKTK